MQNSFDSFMWARYTETIFWAPALKAAASALKVPVVIVWWGGVLGKRRCYTLGKQNLSWGWGSKGRRNAQGGGPSEGMKGESGGVYKERARWYFVEKGIRGAFSLTRIPVTQIEDLDIFWFYKQDKIHCAPYIFRASSFYWCLYYAISLPCCPSRTQNFKMSMQLDLEENRASCHEKYLRWSILLGVTGAKFVWFYSHNKEVGFAVKSPLPKGPLWPTSSSLLGIPLQLWALMLCAYRVTCGIYPLMDPGLRNAKKNSQRTPTRTAGMIERM